MKSTAAQPLTCVFQDATCSGLVGSFQMNDLSVTTVISALKSVLQESRELGSQSRDQVQNLVPGIFTGIS